MLVFIVFLRAIAACLITNSHYTGIYPTDIIANGGLLGDIIFFAVSGYCLFNVKKSFPLWMGKRLLRIYPPVLIITAIYFLLGQYSVGINESWFNWFIFPTNYHFVASILILYVPFYFVGRFEFLRKRIPLIIGCVGIVYLAIYIFFYDKSYYHIDNVHEWMIRLLFFESMLLGAYFKKNGEKYLNKFQWWLPVVTIIAFVIYFASKLFFTKYPRYSQLQILNQLIIVILLYFVFRLFASLEQKLANLPKWINKIVGFIAKITLEIYVVQYVLIAVIRPHLSFPLNWLAITASIIISAFVLHLVCELIVKGIEMLVERIKKSITKKGNID